jgi:hypothetical protein
MRRILAWIALGIVAALALAIAWAYANRAALAERFLLAEFAARGVGAATLRVERIDLDGLALRGIAIGDPGAPDLAIASADLDYTLTGLRAGRLAAIRVSGVRLRGALGDEGLTLGALDPLFAERAGDDATRAPFILPAPVITLADAALELSTPQGVASGALAGTLDASPDGTLAGDFEVELGHPLAHAVGTVVLSGTLEKLAAELVLALRDGRTPARVAPAILRGHVGGAIHALAFDLALDGADGRLAVTLRGSGDAVARTGNADLRIAPLVFAPGALQPATLLPALEPLLAGLGISKVNGSVEARGKLRLDAGTPALTLDVALRGLGFQTALAQISGMAGTISLRAPELRTPKNQLLSVALLDPGVPLADGLIDFQLLPGGAVDLHDTRWSFAGGELRAQNLKLDLAAERTPVVLEAHGLDLSELLAYVKVQGLEATGLIGGEIPLVRTRTEVLVSGAFLRASGAGGTIRYQPSPATQALADSRPNDLGIAVSAFSDFRYHTLEARVDGDLQGELAIGLHVKGANPGFQDNQPIELNLNLEARLLDLVRAGREVYRVPEAVEKRLRSFSDKEKK